MFINCTNHSSSKWSEAQTKAAQELAGEIIDLDFPNVPASSSEQDIGKLSCELTGKLFKLAANKGENEEVFVLLQGETSVICAMAWRSGRNNNEAKEKIPCLTACSERKCIENADGTRTYQFEFQKWRKTFDLTPW